MARSLALAWALAVVPACISPHPPATPAPVQLVPADGATGIGQTLALRVPTTLVPSVFESMYAADLDAGLSLVTYPEMEPVSAQVVRVPPDLADPRDYAFRLEPLAPLTARWYAVIADLTPVMDAYTADPAPLDTADASHHTLVHRFYGGSLPLLGGWAEPAEPGVVTLRTTEPMQLVGGAVLDSLVDFAADGVALRCALSTTSGVANDLAVGQLRFLCDGLSGAARIDVTVSPGLASATGVPLRDPSGHETATLSWTPSLDGPAAPFVLDPDFVASTNTP